jgi:uncharacterized alpha-E superfamily protein
MTTSLNRLMLTPDYFTRTDGFAKFHISELGYYIERTAEMAAMLDAEVSIAIEREGLDPDDWQSELENAVCNISMCRNDAEELHAMLCAIRDVALMNAADRESGTLQ